jgi:ribosomal protein S18 acetylase RimI-like enzyme
MSNLVIAKAVPADAKAISGVLAKTWLATYPNAELGITEQDIRLRVEGAHGERITSGIQKWRERIESTGPNSEIFVARLDDKIVGAASSVIEDGQHRVGAIYVLPEAQGKGVGAKLMNKMLDWLGSNQDIYVVVASYNQTAIDFYKRFGFKETGRQIEDASGKAGGYKQIPEMEMVLRVDYKFAI